MTTLEELNEGARFWRTKLGVNTIPYDTANIFKNPDGGIPLIKWAHLKNAPITDAEFEEMIASGKFKYGIAIMPGKVWHREECRDYFLFAIDIDNEKAMKAFCTMENGEEVALDYFGKQFIIEQHEDDKNRAHLIGYTIRQLKHMSAGGIEVFTEPKHLLNVSPSMHLNGYPIVRSGAALPIIDSIGGMERHLNFAFIRLGFSYIDDNERKNTSSTNPDPFKCQEEPILEGSRHTSLVRKIDSLLATCMGKIPLDDIKQLALNLNQRLCRPPLGIYEVESIWSDAIKFVGKNKNESVNEKQEKTRSAKDLRDIVFKKDRIRQFGDIRNKPQNELSRYQITQLKQIEKYRYDLEMVELRKAIFRTFEDRVEEEQEIEMEVII